MRSSSILKERLMLRRSVNILYCNPNEVILSEGLWNGRTFAIYDEKNTGKLARTIQLLDGSKTIEEIISDINDRSILRFIDELQRNNLLVTLQEQPIGMAESALDLFFGVSEKKLQETKPLIIGDGMLSKSVAEQFSSLNIESTVITCNDTNTSLLEQADYILVLSDYPKPRFYNMINTFALTKKTKWSLAVFDGSYAFITTFVSNETACYNCLEQRLESTLPVYQMSSYLKFKEILSITSVNRFIPKSLVDLVAGFVGTEAINVMGHGQGNLNGKILCVHLPTLTFEVDDVLKLPRCEACGKWGRTKPSRQLYVSMRHLLDMIKRG